MKKLLAFKIWGYTMLKISLVENRRIKKSWRKHKNWKKHKLLKAVEKKSSDNWTSIDNDSL